MPGKSVIEDLAIWGPERREPAVTLKEAQAYCRSLATTHYENFPVVSWLLPRHLHQHFYNIYAYCRWADDLGDETGNPERSLQLLQWWEDELDRCYSGHADHPVFVALRSTITQFEIPRQPFADLISAFVQDQVVLRYESMTQLLDYCRRSANPVGRMILYLCQKADPENLKLSDEICTGLQLANFWQDVARDKKIGRVYLPQDWRDRFGYTVDDLEKQRTTPAFLSLMQALVGDARQHQERGRPLVHRLPGRLRLDIELFVRGGLLILDAIKRTEYRVWDVRPVVTKPQLLMAAFKTLARLP